MSELPAPPPDPAAAAATATAAVTALARLLTVEQLDHDLYRAAPGTADPARRLFGGQVVAQALAAAHGSVGASAGAEREAHSLHAYFLRAGDPRQEVLFHVFRDFDGGSFANRRVVALQGELPILNLSASFQRPEQGMSHAVAMPALAGPEQSTDLSRHAGAGPEDRLLPVLALRLAAFETLVAAIEPNRGGADAIARQAVWFRLRAPPPALPGLAHALLAYASDFALITTAVLPHDVDFFSGAVQAASLDHSLWFHETPKLAEWHCYVMDSPWAGHARGLTRGTIFDRAGRLVASVAQEGLIRLRREPSR